MAIDLEKIKSKLNQISGQGKKKFSDIPVWKISDPGEFRVRCLPWPANLTSDGTPFIERYFYYIPKQTLSTKQFGEEDPVANLIDQLFRSKKPEEKEIAKKLLPKMNAFIRVIVKGEEDKGQQLWRLNRFEYQRILGFLVDEEIGDIFDVENGYELIVKATDTGKKMEGNRLLEKQIDPARKQSHLKNYFDGDVAKMQTALDNPVSVDEFLKFSRKTPSELKLILDKWLSGDSDTVEDVSEGTRKGSSKTSDELEQLKDEISSKKSTKTASTKKKVVEEDLEEDAPVKAKTAIDDAFADLIDDD